MRQSSHNSRRCHMLSGLARRTRLGSLGVRDKRTFCPPRTASKADGSRAEIAARTGQQRLGPVEAEPLAAILVCDHDALSGEALRNFLLAAGYASVDVASTAGEALRRLRHRVYGYVLIAMSRPFSRGWRLAAVVRRRQRAAKILFLVNAKDQPFVEDRSRDYLIKEYVFTNLLELM